MLTCYTPEMNEKRPEEAQIDASLGHCGEHYYLRTPLTLKGRGIILLGTETAETLVPQAQHKVGWHKYKVTEMAFRKICSTHSVAMECLL